MKKCILSAVIGALCMLLMLNSTSIFKTAQEKYEHIDFVSELPQEACFVCNDGSELPINSYWGESNVGIIHLNTFELMYIEINRYDDHGAFMEDTAGYVQTNHLTGNESNAHAYLFPDNGYAQVQITGVQYSIDRESIQNHLCQTCLDSVNSLWFHDDPPAEYAVISFEDRTIRPLVKSCPWFSAGDFGIDCEFKDSGVIDLLIHDRSPR